MNPGIDGLDLPAEFEVASVEREALAGTNDVYACEGTFRGKPIRFYVKAGKYDHPMLDLSNEWAILEELAASGIPVPRVLWYSAEGRKALAIDAIAGRPLEEYIDPSGHHYAESKVQPYLRQYGECLARIHDLSLRWSPHKRARMAGLAGEQHVEDEAFGPSIAWLLANEPSDKTEVLVHGDLNVTHVFFDEDTVTGIIDWEFAGLGWKEFDLAWALKSKQAYLANDTARQAILEGYLQRLEYDPEALRWCEVLNHLRSAQQARRKGALDNAERTLHKARELIETHEP